MWACILYFSSKIHLNQLYYFMDFKEIKGSKHYLYENISEFRLSHPNDVVVGNWRVGKEGDWALTDDGCVLQILRKFHVQPPNGKPPKNCTRTVCGTFINDNKNRKMMGDNGIATNIYTFSGTNRSLDDWNDRKRASRKMMFARYFAQGVDMVRAYKLAYPKAENVSYIKAEAQKLLQTKKVRDMVSNEIKDILDGEGVSPEWIIGKYRDIVDLADSDSNRLRSLDALSKISGLFETEKKTEQLTVWSGFTPEQMEAIKDGNEAKLLAHGEKDSQGNEEG